MNSLKYKLLILVISSILSLTSFSSGMAAVVGLSGTSINSLSISSTRSENSYHYLIEIHIDGIAPSKIRFETDYQTLYLTAQKAGVITDNAIAGAQVIRLAFDFPADANLKEYFRVNKQNKIIISVPKS